MMNDRLSLLQIILLAAYSIGMSVGQVLFKVAATRGNAERPIVERLLDLLQDWAFLTALTLYAGLSIIWVWILSVTPLSRAYPFVALAFVLTPLLGGVVFGEAISVRLVAGMALIVFGLLLVTS